MDLKELTLLSYRNNWEIFRVLLWTQFLLLRILIVTVQLVHHLA
ncbi:MAG: hypothetical protein AB7F86_15185 [Bdellovibrionales bacterium]